MAFDYIESSHKSNIVVRKRPIFLHACAICSGLPSSISTMIHMVTWFAYLQLCRQLHKNKSTLTTKGMNPALSFIFTKRAVWIRIQYSWTPGSDYTGLDSWILEYFFQQKKHVYQWPSDGLSERRTDMFKEELCS